MTDRELKKLSRTELLKLLIEQTKKSDELSKKLEEAENELAKRDIAIKNAGSIAEASLSLSGIFEAAQKAADLYLENVKKLAGEDTEPETDEPKDEPEVKPEKNPTKPMKKKSAVILPVVKRDTK